MRHQKQIHSASEVLVELTPLYPRMQAYLYRDDEYAQAALDHLRFDFGRLRPVKKDSDSVWSTLGCEDYAILVDTTGGVTVMTLMSKTDVMLEELISSLQKGKLEGERLQNWYSPTPQIELPLEAKPIQVRPMEAPQFDMPVIETIT